MGFVLIRIDQRLNGVRVQHGDCPEASRLFDYDDLRRSTLTMRGGCTIPKVVATWLDEVHAYEKAGIE